MPHQTPEDMLWVNLCAKPSHTLSPPKSKPTNPKHHDSLQLQPISLQNPNLLIPISSHHQNPTRHFFALLLSKPLLCPWPQSQHQQQQQWHQQWRRWAQEEAFRPVLVGGQGLRGKRLLVQVGQRGRQHEHRRRSPGGPRRRPLRRQVPWPRLGYCVWLSAEGHQVLSVPSGRLLHCASVHGMIISCLFLLLPFVFHPILVKLIKLWVMYSSFSIELILADHNNWSLASSFFSFFSIFFLCWQYLVSDFVSFSLPFSLTG